MCDIEKMNKDEQISIMKKWFLENFENPAESTPYDSAEGGYIYIWGGPYNAREELDSEFGDIVPEDVIEELVDDLEDDAFEWARIPNEEDFDYDFYTSIEFDEKPVNHYRNSISSVRNFLTINIDYDQEYSLYKMLYVNIISIMEAYLSDTFVSQIMIDKNKIRKLVETTKEFSEQQFKLTEIFNVMENIENIVKDYLAKMVWHNIPKVQALYNNVYGIDMRKHTAILSKAVTIRHDVVHRNGKTKDGDLVIIKKDDIEELIINVDSLVQEIENNIQEI
jgi:hypothetical protein